MPNIEPVFDFVFTDHALTEMARREITQDDVKAVLASPEQMEMVREGRAVYQAKLEMDEPPKTIYCVSFWILIANRLMLLLFTEQARSRSIGDKP